MSNLPASRPTNNPTTNPTIFLRLREIDPMAREMAWSEFHACYAPMIRAFARRLGLASDAVEDVVQDVMIGFFSKSPTFHYDPTKGRFRGYLKVCAHHAAARRFQSNAKEAKGRSNQLDEVAIDHLWEDVWEAELLRQTVEQIRAEMGATKTFQAFERYVILEQGADVIAASLEMHLNSVYRAKEQLVGMLQQRLADRRVELG